MQGLREGNWIARRKESNYKRPIHWLNNFKAWRYIHAAMVFYFGAGDVINVIQQKKRCKCISINKSVCCITTEVKFFLKSNSRLRNPAFSKEQSTNMENSRQILCNTCNCRILCSICKRPRHRKGIWRKTCNIGTAKRKRKKVENIWRRLRIEFQIAVWCTKHCSIVVYLSIFPSVRLSICPFIRLPLSPFIRLSVHKDASRFHVKLSFIKMRFQRTNTRVLSITLRKESDYGTRLASENTGHWTLVFWPPPLA